MLHPLFVRLILAVRSNPILREAAHRALWILLLGIGRPRVDTARGALRGAGSALFRVALISFVIDVYTGGLFAVGLAVPRVVGWAAALAGDLAWFGIYLGIVTVTARFDDDWRVIGVVMAVVVVAFQVGVHVFARRARRQVGTYVPAPLDASPALRSTRGA